MSPHLRHASGRGGHTLIELATVLVLVLVLASLAGPSLTGQVTRSRTRRALDRIASDIAFARMAAVRAGSRAVIDFTSGTTYTVQVQSDPPSPVKEVLLEDDYAGVQITSPTADGELIFDSRGLLITTGVGPIIATSSSASDTAMVTATGRVYRAY